MPLAPLQPSGTASYRGAAARRLAGCMHWLSHSFDLFGGEPVIPATLVSYQDAGSWLSMADDERIRFIDRRSGDVISLRADLTTQVLALSDAAKPGIFWAQGPVYRDGTPNATVRRENHQATFEILYYQPDFAIRYALLAACWLAGRALADPWSLVLGHTDQLTALRDQTGSYVAPGGEAWAGTWQSAAPDTAPVCLEYVRQAQIPVPTLRYNSTLPPSRSYYSGWFFRIYTASAVDPVLSGGQYRDPRTPDVVHAGFGVDVERLADAAEPRATAHTHGDMSRTLDRRAPDLARVCVQLWDQGTRSLPQNS